MNERKRKEKTEGKNGRREWKERMEEKTEESGGNRYGKV